MLVRGTGIEVGELGCLRIVRIESLGPPGLFVRRHAHQCWMRGPAVRFLHFQGEREAPPGRASKYCSGTAEQRCCPTRFDRIEIAAGLSRSRPRAAPVVLRRSSECHARKQGAACEVWPHQVTDAIVHRIVIERKHAVGVSFHHAGHQMTARAEGQIVLTAGSIGSPQLLMLSGLGPAQHLRGLGIDVVTDLPGVGANLHDHPTLPMIWKTRNSTDVLALAQDPRALITGAPARPP
jgi:hypothetical protein